MNIKEVCEAYLTGNTDAIVLLNIAVGVSADLCYIRTNEINWDSTNTNYAELRAELDMAIDSLEPLLTKFNLMPTDLPTTGE
jgi:hypothetical protein